MTDKNKQVEELAKTIYSSLRSEPMSRALASILVGEGYCKSTELAKEIFEEIEKYTIIKVIHTGEVLYDCSEQFAELKKKYTEGME